jgi:hypothetical protein
MKLLEKQFEGKGEVSGVAFLQLEKTKKSVMYQLTETETGQIRYEVFELRSQKAGEAVMGGQTIQHEEKELYPKSAAFGIWAWCFSDFGKALVKFEEIENRPEKVEKTE